MGNTSSMCPPCEQEKNDNLNIQLRAIIKDAIEKAKAEGKREIAMVKSKNGNSWMRRDADDEACQRLPHVLYIYIV